ncbi:uncharacterized protein LOC116255456 isoform X2 [Nymphaea colorata]|nr:uncharacterized protein LOC116255456 isoform X2 [Nymphaea colorata]
MLQKRTCQWRKWHCHFEWPDEGCGVRVQPEGQGAEQEAAVEDEGGHELGGEAGLFLPAAGQGGGGGGQGHGHLRLQASKARPARPPRPPPAHRLLRPRHQETTSPVKIMVGHPSVQKLCSFLHTKVFDYARKEIWYRPEASFYFDMIYMLGRNRLIEKAEYYFLQLQEEGLQPETRIYTEMLAAYMLVDKVDKAMDMYRMMKEAGCRPNELTFTILVRNLQRLGEVAAIKEVENDAVENLEEGEEFLRNVKTRRKNPTLN